MGNDKTVVRGFSRGGFTKLGMLVQAVGGASFRVVCGSASNRRVTVQLICDGYVVFSDSLSFKSRNDRAAFILHAARCGAAVIP